MRLPRRRRPTSAPWRRRIQSLADAGQRDDPAVGLLASYNTPFDPARTPYDWLSRDPAEVDLYVADPFCGDDNPLTYGYLLDLFEVVAPAADRLAQIACPVLVIAGDQDPAAAMGAHPTGLADALRRPASPSTSCSTPTPATSCSTRRTATR